MGCGISSEKPKEQSLHEFTVKVDKKNFKIAKKHSWFWIIECGVQFLSSHDKNDTFYLLFSRDVTGKDVELSIYKGKVLLVVNVASQCGFADRNYTQLSELYNKYKDKDFEILAFPCNQFLSQEPGTNDQIKDFACTKYKAEFPIFGKVDVNGPSAAPVYNFLKSSKGGFMNSSIKWNFTKFLVDKDGHVIGRYATTTKPLAIEKDIKKAMGEQ